VCIAWGIEVEIDNTGHKHISSLFIAYSQRGYGIIAIGRFTCHQGDGVFQIVGSVELPRRPGSCYRAFALLLSMHMDPRHVAGGELLFIDS
jgi:hypothetical protein